MPLIKHIDGGSLKFSDEPFPKQLIRGGIVIIVIFIASLFIWASLAPIDGAVVSPGIIGVSSHRKQIQHLESGIIEAILVTDGDKVKKGQLLVKLRDVTAAAELQRLHGSLVEVEMVIARLEAERSDKIYFDNPLATEEKYDTQLVQSLFKAQTSILNNNHSLIQDQLAVFEKKIDQSQEELSGLKGRIKYKRQEKRLLRRELNNIKSAVEKGLIPKDKELQLGQKYALLNGTLISLQSNRGRLEQQILETRVQQREIMAQRLADLSEQIRSHKSKRFDLKQQIATAQDVMERTRINSPIDGTVVNLQVHSLDGVIQSGQSLMEIVPSDDELVVEAYIDPNDIDDIAVGLPADVRLTSVSRRQRVPLEGVVSQVSADRLINAQSGEGYYSARITLVPNSISREHFALIPGMGVDVFIRTGARTPFDYLLSPIADSIQFALREK
jgi:HlyD family type I secretion membrane fusion protein